jgi:putative thiamine transport system substrate-binding protein
MPQTLNRRELLIAGSALGVAPFAWAQSNPDWQRIETAARGQTVYFNAWGGSERINTYLQWAAGELAQRHAIKLEHVKLGDTAELVRRVRAEKAAGRLSEGSADLAWINGENFLAMKREGLLFGPWSERLPSHANVDTVGKPTTRIDFSEPVEGMEAPWGMAQLTFFADSARVPVQPASMSELLEWAKKNPGRFSYPKPPQFIGTTFLKQLLLENGGERKALYAPHSAEVFARTTAPLWATLDALHPHLWKQGRQFPASPLAMRQMLADGELWLSLTFNPNEAANQIAAKALPATVVSYQHAAGTIGNTHFLGIPFNARGKEAAQVAANFLLSPIAQARKADIRQWGDPTVLALDKLSSADRALFAATAAPGQVVMPAPTWPEPHGTWVDPIEREWTRRYGQG